MLQRRTVKILGGWLAAGGLAGGFVALLWWMSVVPLRGEAPPRQLAIPNGTNAAIERGEEPPGVPRQIELGAGQRLYVVNLDSAEHLIAGTLIRPGTSVVIEPAVLSGDEVACTVHPSGGIAVAIEDSPRAPGAIFRGSLIGAPLGLLAGLIATLGLAGRQRRENDASDYTTVFKSGGLPPGGGLWHNSWILARLAVALFGASLVVLGALIARSPADGVGTTVLAATAKADTVSLPPAEDSGEALFVVSKDEWVPLVNGDTLSAGDLEVSVNVTPFPPGRQANLDLGIARDGAPVAGANVTLEYDMKVMEHGALRLLALPGGAGHYLMPLDFIMAGDFQLKVSVDTGSSTETIVLGVRATR
jgi:hypothetical protein